MYSNHRTCISVPHFVGVFVYAGTINRPLQLLVVCHFVANGLLIMQRSPTKLVANTPPGVGADSSRPYPDIIKYTFSHYQICTFTSSHTHIHIINYVFPFHRTRISTLPNMCFHIIEYVYSFHRIRAFALPHAHIHTTARTFPPPFLWVNTDMRAR